ncbi:MAG: hypothetical protein C4524_14760 [Candidatus Zixiibacteriota bacterium]|nr:MAG: hypothetical protein C4524_14760 [candidate division Zixibacteria bacterium]
MKRILMTLLALALYAGLSLGLGGCGAKMVYLLDQPVSDPIMYADDAQDSDLCKVEDGGQSGSSGECPT